MLYTQTNDKSELLPSRTPAKDSYTSTAYRHSSTIIKQVTLLAHRPAQELSPSQTYPNSMPQLPIYTPE